LAEISEVQVFDKSNPTDGTFSRADFKFESERDRYTCPAGKQLVKFQRTYATPEATGLLDTRPRPNDHPASALKRPPVLPVGQGTW
jgi:hypothetical protein